MIGKHLVILCLLAVAATRTVSGSLNFFFFGDWGGKSYYPYVTLKQTTVASKMGIIGDKYGADFVATLGDNFYYYGVKDVDDKRFKITFEDVYTARSLQIPWYLVAGNHDYRGNVKAQIDYSKRSNRWNFPDYYHKKSFRIPSSGATVDLVMLDTIKLRSESLHSAQWTWIENALKSSRADYLLVSGHHPVYSISAHGPTHTLTHHLLPLLYKYKVTAYFSGHDHDMQHLQSTKDGVLIEHFLSGAASDTRHSNRRHLYSVPPGSSKFYWSDTNSLGAFGFAQVTASNMAVTYYSGSGQVLYKHTVLPRNTHHSVLNPRLNGTNY